VTRAGANPRPCGARVPPRAQVPRLLLRSPSSSHLFILPQPAMTDSKVPQPGPAKLKRNAGPDEWLEAAKDCKYLSEAHMKQLCEIVKEYMMEGKLSPRDFSPEDINPVYQNRIFSPFPLPSQSAVIFTASSTIFSSSFVSLVGCPTARDSTPRKLLPPSSPLPISSPRPPSQTPRSGRSYEARIVRTRMRRKPSGAGPGVRRRRSSSTVTLCSWVTTWIVDISVWRH